jgi:beta-phosphoglucomutase
MMLRAVVFDFDGIIADTEPLHLRAFQELYQRRGVALDEELYHSAYLAFDDRGVIEHHHARMRLPLDPATTKTLIEEKGSIFRSLAEGAPVHPFPGFLPLFEACAGQLPVSVCTSAARNDVEPFLRRFGVWDRLAAITTIEDVPACKPDPAGYRLSLHRLSPRLANLLPGEALAIEDSPGGIRAARDAGLRTLGVAHTCPANALTAADRVVQDLTMVSLPLLQEIVKVLP